MLIFLELLPKFCRPPHLTCRNKKRAPAHRGLSKTHLKNPVVIVSRLHSLHLAAYEAEAAGKLPVDFDDAILTHEFDVVARHAVFD